MVVLLRFDGACRVVLQVRYLLVVVAEVVVLNELQLVLLRGLQVLGAGLDSLPLLAPLDALAVLLVVLEDDVLLLLGDDGARRREDVSVLEPVGIAFFLSLSFWLHRVDVS